MNSNPNFDGLERHLLRATLARIFAATAIVPAKMYTLDPDTEEIKIDDEFVMPDTDALKALTEWGNFNQIILKAGRTTLLAPDAPASSALPSPAEPASTPTRAPPGTPVCRSAAPN